MTPQTPRSWTRNALLRLGIALPTPLLLAACGARNSAQPPAGTAAQPSGPANSQSGEGNRPTLGQTATQPNQQPAPQAQLQPTPECADDDDVTPAQTEGPYFKTNSPRRTSLVESGTNGIHLLLTGRVLATNCRPVANALVDFWQTDAGGAYDNTGYRFRGHQFTNNAGQYRLETLVPGLYPGRTRHIHVKVQAPNRPVLTTQLYFPGEPRNAQDGIFHPELLVAMKEESGGYTALFDFVLNMA